MCDRVARVFIGSYMLVDMITLP